MFLLQVNDLAKIILIYEWEEYMNEFLIDKCWQEAQSWILSYQLALKYASKREDFYDKFKIQKSRNFYQKLFDNNFSLYKSTYSSPKI